MEDSLVWTRVYAYWVASASARANKRPRSEPEGFEDIAKSDVPAEILQVKDSYEWTNFARLPSHPNVFIAGSNKATRLRVAKAISEPTGGHATTSQVNRGQDNHAGQGSHGADVPASSAEGRRTRQSSQSEVPGRSGDGGVKAFFDSSGRLQVEAKRYDKGGADPEAMLEHIFKVVDASQDFSEGFLAVVRLQGLWWSEGTYERKHESSRRCLKVLSGLVHKGCRGLTGHLDLSKNDLDDQFLEHLLRMMDKSDCSLDHLNLDENRITTDGATRLLHGIQSHVRHGFHLQLMHNPIDDCKAVEDKAFASRIHCEVGPQWTRDAAETALAGKNSWWSYFYGPSQLLRSKMLELPSQLHMVECPICDCVLKHDFRCNPQYTVTGNLASHFCGDSHRKNIRRLLESGRSIANILIVSPVWTFTLHPLTGKLTWVQKEDHVPLSIPDQHSYPVQLRPEATSMRAIFWQEGRESMAKEVHPEMAFEILEHRHEVQPRTKAKEAMENPNSGENEVWTMSVSDIEYTQASIAPRFRDGRWLAELIAALNRGQIDPTSEDWWKLEVVQWRDRFYSNDNRRLFCLKAHQRNVDWNVKVRAKVYRPPPVFERFIDRYFERWKVLGGRDRDYIKVRRPPPWHRHR